MPQPFLPVVIPAFHEDPRLLDTLSQVAEYLTARDYGSEVLVADDGSWDRPAQRVARTAREII